MEFPIGYRSFHSNTFLNYQFNRWHALGLLTEERIARVAKKTKRFSDYVAGFELLARISEDHGQYEQAAFAHRAAEFLLPPDDPSKILTYQTFRKDLGLAWEKKPQKVLSIPYAGAHLHAYRYPAAKPQKGRLLVMGGFDSLIEEFTGIWSGLAKAGYEVVAFEGPGQGGTLRLGGLTFDHDYEKPVAAALDYLGWPGAGLIGLSMGGYWALRAAAFEPRIKLVIAAPPVYDWLERTHRFNRWLVRVLMPQRRLMNVLIRQKMRVPTLNHAIKQACFISGGKKPIDAVDWMLGMHQRHLQSELVKQDVLLLGGANDAFQPIILLEKQATALTNARSISRRIFSAAEHADQHCQMGNIELLVRTMVSWLHQHHNDRVQTTY